MALEKFILQTRWDISVVEGKVNAKYITIGTERYTKFQSAHSSYIARRSSYNGFHSNYLYPIDSEYGKKLLSQKRVSDKTEEIKKILDKRNVTEDRLDLALEALKKGE